MIGKFDLWGWISVMGTFVHELYLATTATIRAVLKGPQCLRPAILAVPLDVKSPGGITLFANMVTLTPGTTSLHVSEDRRFLYVHCLDVSDTAEAIHSMKASLERQAMRVLP